MRAVSKLIALIVSLPFILFAISFAISNRDAVAFRLWPFDAEVGMPLVLAVFVILLGGFVIGALASFIGAGRLRRRTRTAEARVRELEIDLARERRKSEIAVEKAREEGAVAALEKADAAPAIAAE